MTNTKAALLTPLLVLTAASLLWAQDPWEAQPFSAPPAEVLAAAEKTPRPPGSNAVVLFKKFSYHLDEQRRLDYRIYRVAWLQNEAAAQEWELLEAVWTPWHQERPEIRARVIRAGGEAIELDPRTIAEAPVEGSDPTILSDQRRLRAPMPGVAAGAVVEQEIAWRDKQPFFAAGVLETAALSAYVPINKLRIVIEAPPAIRLRHQARAMDLTAKTESDEQQTRIVYEANSIAAFRSGEPDQPPGMAEYPHVAFSTGQSWAALAAAYAELVEPRIDAKSIEGLVKTTLAGDESRREAAVKLTAKTRELVRYTGLEFGTAAIVPYPPRETLQRRYGDCKDQATLLVSLLRAAGHPADIALLRAGTTEELNDQLPGLNAFNHAIVYVPGDPPLWIDPTSRYTPVGQLPVADQNRLALIANPATQQLVRTPRALSQDNLVRETMVAKLAPQGQMRIQRSVAWSGSGAAELRSLYAATNRADLQQGWTDFAEQNHGTRKLTSFEFTDPLQVDVPFEVKIAMDEATWGDVGPDAAGVAVTPYGIFDRLPWYMTRAEQPQLPADSEAAVFFHRRKHPLYLHEPYASEYVYRISPPAGYVLHELPASRKQTIGPATFEQKFNREDDQTVVAEFRFDTGAGVFTPEQVSQLRGLISGLAPDGDVSLWQVTLLWDHAAHKLFLAGKYREALDQYRALLREHAEELSHHVSYADALLKAGLNSAAVGVMERAIEAAPGQAMLYGQLGFLLMHDPLGRQTQLGYDRQAAVAAFRKAIELEPENRLHRFNFAVLLEHDEYGNRYTPGEDLQEAIAQYRQLRETGADANVDANLAFCLLYQAEFEALQKLLKEISEPQVQTGLSLAVTAILHGAPAARAAANVTPGSRQDRSLLMLAAAEMLEAGGHYPQAQQLYLAAAPGSTNPALVRHMASVMARFKTFDQVAAPPEDPRRAVQELLGDMLANGVQAERIHRQTANQPKNLNVLEEWFSPFLQGRQNSLLAGTPSARRRDAVGVLTYEVEGDDQTGYRVRVDGEATERMALYVVRQEDRGRVWLPGERHAELGIRALELLDDGQVEAARTWLGWARDELSIENFLDQMSGQPFARLWALIDKNDVDQLRAAAATLAATADDVQTVIPILETALGKDESPFRKVQLQRALASAYATAKQAQKLRKLTEELSANFPIAFDVVRGQTFACYLLRDADRLEQLGATLCEQTPGSPWGQRCISDAAAYRGDYAAAYEAFRKIDDEAFSFHYNEAAWRALFLEELPEQALEHAQRAVELSNHTDAAALHTLATVYAERGDVDGAKLTLQRAVEVRPDGRLRDYDWYVIGRIAEHCGLPDDAKAAYQRVDDDDRHPYSTFALAQQRLKRMAVSD